MDETGALLDILTRGGLLAGTIIIILSGFKEVWVWGRQYREMRRERDTWREIALSTTNLAEKAVSALKSGRGERNG